jgi:hypothetical protein
MGGFIVGFDSDPADIFQRQFEFIQRSGVVTAMVGLLTALPETRLYQAADEEGRLETESTETTPRQRSISVPGLDREFLINGYRELMKELYNRATTTSGFAPFWSTTGRRGPRCGSHERRSRPF